jgi:hypothetical protein
LFETLVIVVSLAKRAKVVFLAGGIYGLVVVFTLSGDIEPPAKET